MIKSTHVTGNMYMLEGRGDSIIHFRANNVIHMGDNFFKGMYPLVDRSSGGSVQGMIDAAQFALGLCDSETKVIPGHGELSHCADLEDFGQMLADATGRMRELAERGMTLEQITEARPRGPGRAPRQRLDKPRALHRVHL